MVTVTEQTENCMRGCLFVSEVSLHMYEVIQTLRKRAFAVAARALLICLFHSRTSDLINSPIHQFCIIFSIPQ